MEIKLILPAAIQEAHSLVYKTQVHIKAHRAYLSALVASQEVSGTPYLQILHSHLEAGSKAGVVRYYPEPLHSQLCHCSLVRIEKICIGKPVGAPYSAAELIELGDAVHISPVYDYGVHIRDIDAVLYYGCGDKDMDLLMDKPVHYILKLCTAHLAMGCLHY